MKERRGEGNSKWQVLNFCKVLLALSSKIALYLVFVEVLLAPQKFKSTVIWWGRISQFNIHLYTYQIQQTSD